MTPPERAALRDPEPLSRTALEAHIRANPVEGDHHQMRRAFAALAPPSPALTIDRIDGIPVEIHKPDATRTILFLHGGGYVFGAPRSHAAAAVHLAAITGCRVIAPAYRLAPEHVWPAPLEDAAAVLASLDTPVAVVGDSAGGHLAISLALKEPDRVSRLVLISPNTDRSGKSRTRRANSDTDLMNDDATDRALSNRVLGHLPDDDPHASPLLADLSRLPRVWITASEGEVLLDDTRLFTDAARQAGVYVAIVTERGLFHMWTLWPGFAPARRSWDRIATFLTA